MTTFHFPNRNIEALADEFVRSRSDRASTISLQDGIRALRTLLPDAPLSDQEVAAIIAGRAVEHGLAVDFDHQILPTR